MTASPEDLFRTLALLALVAVPLGVAVGGAAFVPWRAPYWQLRHLRTVIVRHRWILLGLVATLAFDLVVQYTDPWATRLVDRDFTGWFSDLEGDVHRRLQGALAWDAFERFFGLVYVLGFPFLVNFTTVLFVWLDAGRDASRALLGYAYCMLFGFPFYLFFPVTEVWATGKAENLAVAWQPQVEEHLYAFNEVNNGFPSLHTAMSVAVAYAAWTSDHRGYRWFAAGLATLIVFATVYTGIHWVTDVAAGLVLGAFVCWLMDRTVPRRRPERAAAASKRRAELASAE